MLPWHATPARSPPFLSLPLSYLITTHNACMATPLHYAAALSRELGASVSYLGGWLPPPIVPNTHTLLCTTLRFLMLTVCVSGCPSPSVLCSRNAESWGSHIVAGMVQVTEHVCVHRHRSSLRPQKMGTLPRWSASSPPGPTSITKMR